MTVVTVLLAGVQPNHRRLLTRLTGPALLPDAALIHPDAASAILHARTLLGPPDRSPS